MGGVQKWFFTEGQKVGELTYLGEAPFHIQRNGRRVRKCRWKCRCGKIFNTTLPLVLRTYKKPVRSCGCIKSEAVRKSSTKHGLCGTKIYSIWVAMKARCYSTDHPSYGRYGGRGIKVFPAWRNNVVKFYDYVSNLPGYEGGMKGDKRNKLSLDRIDNDKGYRPGNLRWADSFQQMNNTRKQKKRKKKCS